MIRVVIERRLAENGEELGVRPRAPDIGVRLVSVLFKEVHAEGLGDAGRFLLTFHFYADF